MALSFEQFIRELDEVGLLAASEVRAFCESLPAHRRPSEAKHLAVALIRAGKLTQFQASRVYHGRAQELLLGNYVLHARIGHGGMGVVYEAQHRWMKRRVAIKVLSSQVTKSARALRRFRREVEVAARLSHPNIVTAFDADEYHHMHFLVMEFVDGPDLAEVVDREGPFSVARALDCMIQAAQGLAFAHTQGIVHRDIKPHNLLLDRSGQIKISDMGLVLFDQAEPQTQEMGELTEENQILGTVDYMAPEQALNTHLADGRSDIYSLGCTLYRLLVGKPPYRRETSLETLIAHREQPIPSLQAARNDIPDLLESIYQRMLAKTPEQRYQTVGQLVGDLEQCRALVTAEPRRTSAGPEPPPVRRESEDSELLRFLQNNEDEESADRSGGGHRSQTLTHDETTVRPQRASHPAKSGTSGALAPQTRDRRSRPRSLIFWVINLASVLLLMGIIGVFLWKLTRPSTLVLRWPLAEQVDARLEVDDERIPLLQTDHLQLRLDPGTHRILVLRRGFAPIRRELRLERGQEQSFPLRWTPVDISGVESAYRAAEPDATSPKGSE